MNDSKLVSMLIFSYNNLQYINQCLDSILLQDYPNIEIIISDDGSDNFNKDIIEEYIEKNKKDNISNYVVRTNEKNLGIVKNINNAIKEAKGDYFVHIACDDALTYTTIISKIVKFYENYPEYMIAVGFVGCFDETLTKWEATTPTKDNIKFINQEAKICFLKLCRAGSFFPSPGMSYTRELIDKYGLYDEEYVMLDDYSRFVYLTRMGCRIGFIPEYLVKYRAGGSTSNKKSKVMEQIRKDTQRVIEKEIAPYL